MPKGQENVDKTIERCRDIIAALDGLPLAEKANSEDTKQHINRIIEGLQEISGKFFLKSNPSIPPTNVCLKSVEELSKSLPASEEDKDHTTFINALDSFEKAFESLKEKASMRGTVIT